MPPGRIFIFCDEADDRRVKISNTKSAGPGLQTKATESGADSRPVLRYEAFVSNIGETERALRNALRNHRCRDNIEWYNINLDDAISLVDEAEKALSNTGVLTFINYERPQISRKVEESAPVQAAPIRAPAPRPERKTAESRPAAASVPAVNPPRARHADEGAQEAGLPEAAAPPPAAPPPAAVTEPPAAATEPPARERAPRGAGAGAVGEKDIQFIGFLLRTRRDAIFKVMINHIINCVFWGALAIFIAIVTFRSADKITPAQSSVKVLIGANFILMGCFMFIVWREVRLLWRAFAEPVEMYGVWHFKWLSLSTQMGVRHAADLALRLYDELGKAARKGLIEQHFADAERRSKPDIAAECINMPVKKAK